MQLLVVLLLSACFFGCSKKDEAKPKATEEGKYVVEIRGDAVILDGDRIATTKEIDAEKRHLKLDDLSTTLTSRRTIYREKSRDRPDPTVALLSDEGVSMRAFKSVFQTVGFGGFARISVHHQGAVTELSPKFPTKVTNTPEPERGKRMHVYLYASEVHVIILQETTVISESVVKLTRDDAGRAVTSKIVEAFRANSLGAKDQVVLFAHDELTAKHLFDGLRWVDAAASELGGSSSKPPFWLRFSIKSINEPGK